MQAERESEHEQSVEFHRRRSSEEYQAAYRASAPAVKMKHLALALEHSIRAYECREASNPDSDEEMLIAAKLMLRQAFDVNLRPYLKFTDWG